MEYIYYIWYLFALLVVGAVLGIIGYYIIYGVVCFFAWVEEEVERFLKKRRRQKRLEERARRIQAGIERTVR